MVDKTVTQEQMEADVGEVLFREGEPGDAIFVIRSGKVKIWKMFHGKEHVLTVLKQGDMFGELSLMNRTPRSATATVVEKATLMVIDEFAFREMLRQESFLVAQITNKLARRVMELDSVVNSMVERALAVRVMLELRQLAQLAGERKDDGSVFISYGVAKLADLVAVDEKECLEILWRFSGSSSVRVGKDSLTIQEPEALQSLVLKMTGTMV